MINQSDSESDSQAQLGLPWFIVDELPVYRPWQLFAWWYAYDAYAPEVFDKAGMLAGASGFMACGSAIVGSLWRAPIAAGHHLRLVALGEVPRNRASRAVSVGRRVSRAAEEALSPP